MKAVINVFNVGPNLTLIQRQNFAQNIVEMEKDLFLNVMMVEMMLEMDVIAVVKLRQVISVEVVLQILQTFVNNMSLLK